jgi:hypothetical protein
LYDLLLLRFTSSQDHGNLIAQTTHPSPSSSFLRQSAKFSNIEIQFFETEKFMKMKIYLTLQFHFIFSIPLKRDYLLEEMGASRRVTTSDSPPTDLSTCLVANKRGAAHIIYSYSNFKALVFTVFFFNIKYEKREGKNKNLTHTHKVVFMTKEILGEHANELPSYLIFARI